MPRLSVVVSAAITEFARLKVLAIARGISFFMNMICRCKIDVE
jgi:hypothetical protein